MAMVYLLRRGEADYGPIRERNWPGAVGIVSSPMTRALQTAALLAWELGLLVEVDLELREWLPMTPSAGEAMPTSSPLQTISSAAVGVARWAAPEVGAAVPGPGAGSRRAH